VTIDDYLFDPCGYSMNGVLKNVSFPWVFNLEEINLTFVLLTNQGEYMTIHITPEAKFSYVSFESNIPQSSYMDVIARVLETFRPGKFIVTSFANKVF
jgi:S-adenosylmethionine decarboxylase